MSDIDERPTTARRQEWTESTREAWAAAIANNDRAAARALYDEFGGLLAEEVAEEGGSPVLSLPEVNRLIRQHLQALRHSPGVRGRIAVDVGCGPTPVAALALADAGFVAVGVDIAHSITKLAAERCGDRVRLVVADAERLPFRDGAVGVVTCDDTIEHVFDQGAVVAELARMMPPAGKLLVVTPNASGLHVAYQRTRDLLHGRRLPRTAYHITSSHVRELRWRELDRLFRPWFVRRTTQSIGYHAPGIWRVASRAVALPGCWRWSAVHFVELERRGNRAPARDHYGILDRPEDQMSPGVVRAALAGWEAAGIARPVLDIGTGVGGNLPLLRQRGPVIGTEISFAAARRAADHAPVVVADAARLPFRSGAVGAVVCTEVLEHVDDPGGAFAEMARVLAPGGTAFVTAPNYANLAGVHKWLADRRSGRHDWNPWGAHEGGYEAFMTGRRLWRSAAPHFSLVRARGLDHGQALTGRFRPLDALAHTRVAGRALRRLLPALEGSTRPLAAWHGMHVELRLRRR